MATEHWYPRAKANLATIERVYGPAITAAVAALDETHNRIADVVFVAAVNASSAPALTDSLIGMATMGAQAALYEMQPRDTRYAALNDLAEAIRLRGEG